jgi:hypothetical protein
MDSADEDQSRNGASDGDSQRQQRLLELARQLAEQLRDADRQAMERDAGLIFKSAGRVGQA